MAAVAEKPKHQEVEQKSPEDMIRDRIQNWKMPIIGVGDQVVFFGNPFDRKTARCGEVVEVGQRAITVMEKGSGAIAGWRYEVHHVDDPKLEASIDIRQYGAWDYNDQTKRFFALERKVDELLKKLGE